MKSPLIKQLIIPSLKQVASSLKTQGKLAVSNNNLTYLDIEDEYIHKLFPLLKEKQITKPNYFGENAAGAHITVIYPEENRQLNKEDLNQTHHFTINNVVTAQIGLKTYYALMVDSPSLLTLRKKYSLTDKLCFKGYAIGLHITIGVKI